MHLPKGIVGFRNDGAWPHGIVQYDRPLPRRDIEHFGLEPLDPLDPINVRRAFERFRDCVYDNFAENSIVRMPLAGG